MGNLDKRAVACLIALTILLSSFSVVGLNNNPNNDPQELSNSIGGSSSVLQMGNNGVAVKGEQFYWQHTDASKNGLYACFWPDDNNIQTLDEGGNGTNPTTQIWDADSNDLIIRCALGGHMGCDDPGIDSMSASISIDGGQAKDIGSFVIADPLELDGEVASLIWVDADTGLKAVFSFYDMYTREDLKGMNGEAAGIAMGMELKLSCDSVSFSDITVNLHLETHCTDLDWETQQPYLWEQESDTVLYIQTDYGPTVPLGDPHEITLSVVNGTCVIAEASSEQFIAYNTIVGRNPATQENYDYSVKSGSQVQSGQLLCLIPYGEFINHVKNGNPVIMSNGQSVEYRVVDGEYFFTMPDGDTSVTIEFDAHTVTKAGSNGQLDVWVVRGSNSHLSTSLFFPGEHIYLTPNPDSGYEFTGYESFIFDPNVSIQQETVTIGNQPRELDYFVMGDQDVSITMNYSRLLSITINESVGGTVTVSKLYAKAGDYIDVTITPDDGYELDEITFSPQLTISNSRFQMPDSDVTITATFKPLKQMSYTLTKDGDYLIVGVDVVKGLGSNLDNPMFVTIGDYYSGDRDIVINVYSKITNNEDHKEYVALSMTGLDEVWIHLVDGISTNLTDYYVHVDMHDPNLNIING